MKRSLFPLLILLSFFFLACNQSEEENFKPYTGPIYELHNISMNFNDSARTVVHMVTETQFTYENDDKRYPKEVKLWFYDKFGNISSQIRGDSAKYTRASNTYTLMGNVKIYNPIKQETMSTPEFVWYPDFSEIRSDSSVQVHTPTQVLYGKGFVAKQDFSEYYLKRVTKSVLEVPNLPTAE